MIRSGRVKESIVNSFYFENMSLHDVFCFFCPVGNIFDYFERSRG